MPRPVASLTGTSAHSGALSSSSSCSSALSECSVSVDVHSPCASNRPPSRSAAPQRARARHCRLSLAAANDSSHSCARHSRAQHSPASPQRQPSSPASTTTAARSRRRNDASDAASVRTDRVACDRHDLCDAVARRLIVNSPSHRSYSSSERLPAPAQRSPSVVPESSSAAVACSSDHLNVDQLVNIVHSFFTDRHTHCVFDSRHTGSHENSASHPALTTSRSAKHCQDTLTDSHNEPLEMAGPSFSGVPTPDIETGNYKSVQNHSDDVTDERIERARCVVARATLSRLCHHEPHTAVFCTARRGHRNRSSSAYFTPSVTSVIDALHAQFDRQLRGVRAVRVDAGAVYVSMTSGRALDALLAVRLVVCDVPLEPCDAAVNVHVLLLTGVPHYVTDASMRLLMRAFGVVLGAVERRFYRGVDTGDRVLKLRCVAGARPPSTVTVGGATISVQQVQPSEITECDPSTVAELASMRVDHSRLNSTCWRRQHALQRRHHSVGSYLHASSCSNAGSTCSLSSLTATAVDKDVFTSSLEINLRPKSAPDVRCETTSIRSTGEQPPAAAAASQRQVLAPSYSDHLDDGATKRSGDDKHNFTVVLSSSQTAMQQASMEHADTLPPRLSRAASKIRSGNKRRLHKLRMRLPRVSTSTRSSQSGTPPTVDGTVLDPAVQTTVSTQTLPSPLRHREVAALPSSSSHAHQQPVSVVEVTGPRQVRIADALQFERSSSEINAWPGDSASEQGSQNEPEHDSQDSQDVSDLPWCGCWGNGCF